MQHERFFTYVHPSVCEKCFWLKAWGWIALDHAESQWPFLQVSCCQSITGLIFHDLLPQALEFQGSDSGNRWLPSQVHQCTCNRCGRRTKISEDADLARLLFLTSVSQQQITSRWCCFHSCQELFLKYRFSCNAKPKEDSEQHRFEEDQSQVYEIDSWQWADTEASHENASC